MGLEIGFVCMPVSEGPPLTQGSEQRDCCLCSCAVWVAPSSVELIKDREVKFYCIPCAEKTMKAGDILLPPTPKQEHEISLRDRRN